MHRAEKVPQLNSLHTSLPQASKLAVTAKTVYLRFLYYRQYLCHQCVSMHVLLSGANRGASLKQQ